MSEWELSSVYRLPSSMKWNYCRVAYDGSHLVIAKDDQIVAFDATGKVLGRLAPLPAGEHDNDWAPFLTRQGRELLLFNGRNTIYRLAMP